MSIYITWKMIDSFMFFKFPPLFTYKREKTGNYTYGGLFNELMEDVQTFFNVR